MSGCPLVLKGVIHAFYSCKEPFFAQGRVCRSLRLLQRPVTEQPHDNIDPRGCHCVPCLGGLSPMKAAPTFSAGERRSPRWLRTPGVQMKRPQSCLEVSELPRSLRWLRAAAARRSGRHEQPALVAAASGSSLPSLPPRLMCSQVAAVVATGTATALVPKTVDAAWQRAEASTDPSWPSRAG